MSEQEKARLTKETVSTMLDQMTADVYSRLVQLKEPEIHDVIHQYFDIIADDRELFEQTVSQLNERVWIEITTQVK